MNPLTVLGGLINGITNYLEQQRINQTFENIYTSLGNILEWIANGFTGIAFSMYEEWGAVTYVRQNFNGLGGNVADAFNDVEGAIDRVTFTILPNSLGFLSNQIYYGWIQPHTNRLNTLDDEVSSLQASRYTDETWLYGWIVPNVRDLLSFEDAFKRGDQPSINVLIDWLRNPDHFADFTVPRIANALALYINAPAQEALHKGWAYVMVNVWEREASAIWDAVLRWSVANT